MTDLRVVFLLAFALPHTVHAQDCLGSPVAGSVAIGTRGLVAAEWLGVGARAVAQAASTHFAIDGDLLRHETGARALYTTVQAGFENGGRTRICAYLSGSLFRRDSIAVSYMWDTEPSTHYISEMSGRAGSVGVGFARWIVGGKVDWLLHAAGEGMVMKRDRTGDGAFIYIVGAGIAVSRVFIGVAVKGSTPDDVVLLRTDYGGNTRLLLNASMNVRK